MEQPGDMSRREAEATSRLETLLAGLPEEVQRHEAYPPSGLSGLIRILDETASDDASAEKLRRELADPALVERLVQRGGSGIDAVSRLVGWGGGEVAEPLLDALSELDSREARRSVLDMLVEHGPSLGPGIRQRLEDERWYVRRNMLSLLEQMPDAPEGFSALPYLEDPDPRVRREALLLALDRPERDEAVNVALDTEDEGLLRLALAATEAFCPPAVEQRVAGHAADDELPTPLRVAAVRALNALRQKLEAPRRVRRLLRQEPPDLEGAEEILSKPWAGRGALEPALDVLAELESRSTRRRIFGWLSGLDHPELPQMVAERLDDDRWYVRRNMLGLLQELPERPEGFSARPLLEDPDERVRVEAFKLAVEEPSLREEAVQKALRSDHDRLIGLALAAAESVAPPGSAPSLISHLEDEDLSESQRAMAARALGHVPRPSGRDALLSVAWEERKLLSDRLREKTPLVLGALTGLARGWPDDPRVQPVLEAARGSDDPEVRRAVDTV